MKVHSVEEALAEVRKVYPAARAEGSTFDWTFWIGDHVVAEMTTNRRSKKHEWELVIKPSYFIRPAKQTGGKAGKSHNKTSTIQVFQGSMIVKMFRFNVNDPESMRKARAKADAFVKSQTQREV